MLHSSVEPVADARHGAVDLLGRLGNLLRRRSQDGGVLARRADGHAHAAGTFQNGAGAAFGIG